MPRSGVDSGKIIQTAVEITEAGGIDAVTLKEISERLNVSSSSLYNHVENLAEIKTQVSYHALGMLKESMLKASLGKSGTDVLKAIGAAYVDFATNHPYLYETIQWMNVWDNTEERTIFSDLMRLAWNIGSEIGLDDTESNHIMRSLRCFVHGFASIESHNGFGHKAHVQESLEYALDTFITGVKNRTRQDS